MSERVITYIDGFNFYFGLKSAGWKRYYWLNLQVMAQNLEAYQFTVAIIPASSLLAESYDDLRTTAEKRTPAMDKKRDSVAQDVVRFF
jgi:hypothetical protein